MIQRCTNPNAKKYPLYGGAGVTVCDRWLNSFENFLADMGERLTNTSLGRFLDIGNYKPGNCKWMTYREQADKKVKKLERKNIMAAHAA